MLNFLKKLLGIKSNNSNKTGLLNPQHNVNPAPKYKKPKAPENTLETEYGLEIPKNIPKMPKVKKARKEETAPKKRGRPPKNKS